MPSTQRIKSSSTHLPEVCYSHEMSLKRVYYLKVWEFELIFLNMLELNKTMLQWICCVGQHIHVRMLCTVNSEIFARILFSRIALKDISAGLKIRNFGMI